jgi:hypothetical protein
VIEEVTIDDHWLGRIVEVVLDVFQLGKPATLGDIQSAFMKGQAVGPIEPGSNHLVLAFAVALKHRPHRVEQALAGEQRSLAPPLRSERALAIPLV